MKTCLLTVLFIVLSNPLFFAGTYDGGSGTSGSPYLISSAAHLAELQTTTADWASGKYFIQTADILVSGTWTPVGISGNNFTGSYDGQGHTISGITISNTTSNQGMFGVCNGATLQNLGLINLSISGGSNTGGLVGLVQGNGATISKCFTSGSVAGTYNNVGGLIGECYYNGSITDCYSRASVATNSHSGGTGAGGLIGSLSNSTISNCYSTGWVSGSNMNGGLLAANSGTVNNSFWDTQTSGQVSSAGGTGKTTTQMKTDSTFTDAGWSSSIWNIDAAYNDGYPHLDWQNTGGTPLPVELISFKANVGTDFISLHWQTATEVNNYGFQVESKKDKVESNWETIGFVNGHGNSNSPKDYSFIDKNVAAGNYLYRLKQIDNNGEFSYSSEIEVNVETIPTEFALYQNYPNPFNPTTTIKYSVPKIINNQSSIINLKVYDILGNEVATLVNVEKEPGIYEVEWNASDLATGIYLYRLQSNGFVTVRKALFIK